MSPTSGFEPLNYRLASKYVKGDLMIVKYDVGSVVVLTFGKTVYITHYNESSKNIVGSM